MQYKVIDNFLEEKNFKDVLEHITSTNFPWYYADSIVKKSKSILSGYQKQPEDVEFDPVYDFQFCHMLYRDYEFKSQAARVILKPFFKKLDVKASMRVKVNCGPNTPHHIKSGFHRDSMIEPPHLTALYYLNTNNGWTEFKDGRIVESVANRMLIFPSNLYHTGVSCTDEKVRLVINFNFYSSSFSNLVNAPNS